MYSAGRVKFVEIDGDHLRFTDADLNNIFIPFLRGEQNIQGIKHVTPDNIHRINVSNQQFSDE